MKDYNWNSIADMFIILLALLVIVVILQGCDPTDPENSVNAIYLNERIDTTQSVTVTRFIRVNSQKELSPPYYINVYKDSKNDGCELIVITVIDGFGNVEILESKYIDHDRRRYVR